MVYPKKTWITNEVITTAALNNIEDGVANLDAGNIATLRQTAPVQAVTLGFDASDEVRYGDYTLVYAPSTTYTQVFSKRVPQYYAGRGLVRIKFDLLGDDIGDSRATALGRIYVNGVATGTERSNSVETWVTYSEDILVYPGDTIEIWAKYSGDGPGAIRNFLICCTDSIYLGNKDAAW